MKSTELQILDIGDADKKYGCSDDVEKGGDDKNFVIVHPMTAEFPYIPPSNTDIEQGHHAMTESTETIVRHHRRQVIQAIFGYLLLVALILLIAFIARNSMNYNK